MNWAGIGQRVFNVFHHVEDQTLPYDLWREDTELAAMVYLLKQHPREEAVARYTRVVDEYHTANARIGIPTRPFRAARARQKMTVVSAFIDTLPEEIGAAAIYRKLVSADTARHNRKIQK